MGVEMVIESHINTIKTLMTLKMNGEIHLYCHVYAHPFMFSRKFSYRNRSQYLRIMANILDLVNFPNHREKMATLHEQLLLRKGPINDMLVHIKNI